MFVLEKALALAVRYLCILQPLVPWVKCIRDLIVAQGTAMQMMYIDISCSPHSTVVVFMHALFTAGGRSWRCAGVILTPHSLPAPRPWTSCPHTELQTQLNSAQPRPQLRPLRPLRPLD